MNVQSLLSRMDRIFSKNRQILAVYIIGSFAVGNLRKESDFDLVIVTNNRDLLTIDEVYNSIRHLSFPKNLDLSIVDNNSSPLFLYQTTSRGKRIYERSEKEASDFEAQVLHQYYDTNYIREIYYSYLKTKFT